MSPFEHILLPSDDIQKPVSFALQNSLILNRFIKWRTNVWLTPVGIRCFQNPPGEWMFKVNWQASKHTVCKHQFSKLVMNLYQADILYNSNLSFNHTYSNAECFTKSETYEGYLQWHSNWGAQDTRSHSSVVRDSECSGTWCCQWACSSQLCQTVFFHFFILNKKSVQYFKTSGTSPPSDATYPRRTDSLAWVPSMCIFGAPLPPS